MALPQRFRVPGTFKGMSGDVVADCLELARWWRDLNRDQLLAMCRAEMAWRYYRQALAEADALRDKAAQIPGPDDLGCWYEMHKQASALDDAVDTLHRIFLDNATSEQLDCAVQGRT